MDINYKYITYKHIYIYIADTKLQGYWHYHPAATRHWNPLDTAAGFCVASTLTGLYWLYVHIQQPAGGWRLEHP